MVNPPSTLPGPQSLQNPRNGQWSPLQDRAGRRGQCAADHCPGQEEEACFGTQKSVHYKKGLVFCGLLVANSHPVLSDRSVHT